MSPNEDLTVEGDRRTLWHSVLRATMIVTVIVLAGCDSMLPRSKALAESGWGSFADARAAFDKLELHKTRADELAKLGFDPFASANVTLLNYSDLIRRFVPGTVALAGSIDGDILDCIAVKERCRAVEVDISNSTSERVGSFFLDFLNFRRRTEISGWRFNAVVVLKDDVVVYKLWGGRPMIKEVIENRNPIGPLQSGGEKLLSY
jgi:hypothetical protein